MTTNIFGLYVVDAMPVLDCLYYKRDLEEREVFIRLEIEALKTEKYLTFLVCRDQGENWVFKPSEIRQFMHDKRPV